MTYQQAIKRPQAGWAYADNESMLAVMSDVLGRAFCLNPERIFDWAKMHSSYRELRNRACELLDEPPEKMTLLVAVINDLPLDKPPANATTEQPSPGGPPGAETSQTGD